MNLNIYRTGNSIESNNINDIVLGDDEAAALISFRKYARTAKIEDTMFFKEVLEHISINNVNNITSYLTDGINKNETPKMYKMYSNIDKIVKKKCKANEILFSKHISEIKQDDRDKGGKSNAM